MTAPAYRIDGGTLREVLVDTDAARRYVADLEGRGPEGDAERVVWLRMLGDLDAAERLGRVVLERAGTGTRRSVAPALRLAHVLHWQGRYREADDLFDAARALAQDALDDTDEQTRRWGSAMVAFTDQHQGKARLDEGRVPEALQLFRRASTRRVADGAPQDQVASSRQAEAAARARLRRA